jgi:hypothetical protein
MHTIERMKIHWLQNGLGEKIRLKAESGKCLKLFLAEYFLKFDACYLEITTLCFISF